MIVGSLNDTGRAPSKLISSRETQIIGGPAKEGALCLLWHSPIPAANDTVQNGLLRVETMPLSIRCLCYKAHRAFFGPSFQHHGLIQPIAMSF
jgi:hypothetical protein